MGFGESATRTSDQGAGTRATGFEHVRKSRVVCSSSGSSSLIHIDETEQGRIRADAQRERERGDEGEARVLEQLAEAEFEVVQDLSSVVGGRLRFVRGESFVVSRPHSSHFTRLRFSSLSSQCDRGIDLGRPARREVAGQSRGCPEQ